MVAVLNQGSVPATDVRIVAQVPEQMVVQDAKGPSSHRQEGQLLTFEPLATLKPHGELAMKSE